MRQANQNLRFQYDPMPEVIPFSLALSSAVFSICSCMQEPQCEPRGWMGGAGGGQRWRGFSSGLWAKAQRRRWERACTNQVAQPRHALLAPAGAGRSCDGG